jgi:hypothetical protein
MHSSLPTMFTTSFSGRRILQVRQCHWKKLLYRVLWILTGTWMTAPRERAQMALVILSRTAAFPRYVARVSVLAGVKGRQSWPMVFRKREWFYRSVNSARLSPPACMPSTRDDLGAHTPT